MIQAYPIRLIPDDNNTVRVEFPDFPEAHTFGDDEEEALAHAVAALETVIQAYVRDGRPIPPPRTSSTSAATVTVHRA